MQVLSDVISLYPFLLYVPRIFQAVLTYTIIGLAFINAAVSVASLFESRVQTALRTIAFYVTDYTARILFIPAAGTNTIFKK